MTLFFTAFLILANQKILEYR